MAVMTGGSMAIMLGGFVAVFTDGLVPEVASVLLVNPQSCCIPIKSLICPDAGRKAEPIYCFSPADWYTV